MLLKHLVHTEKYRLARSEMTGGSQRTVDLLVTQMAHAARLNELCAVSWAGWPDPAEGAPDDITA
jgi:hypothetical protein